MVQLLQAHSALVEDPSSFLSTRMVVHTLLTCSRHACGTCTHIQAKHSYPGNEINLGGKGVKEEKPNM